MLRLAPRIDVSMNFRSVEKGISVSLFSGLLGFAGKKENVRNVLEAGIL